MKGMVSRYPQVLEVPRPVIRRHLSRAHRALLNPQTGWMITLPLLDATIAFMAVRESMAHGPAAAGDLWVCLTLALVGTACHAVAARMIASDAQDTSGESGDGMGEK